MDFRFKFYLLLLVLTTAVTPFLSAQEIDPELSEELMNQSNIKGPLEFKGSVKELSKKLKGATVTLYSSPDGSHENLTEIFKTTTGGNGQFEFKLEINKFYVLSVQKGGYTTKKVDFDTDVTLAREQYNSVPTFEFEVDMVRDTDGLDFVGSVASVFYQLKTNRFDYQLDYTKEEMEDEERERREREERARLAQLAFEKKQQVEEAAKILLDKENATAEALIKAAVTVGDGNKEKTLAGFMDVFPEVDTLRGKKALIMYDKLQEERKQNTASTGEINFQAIFSSAKNFEETIKKEAEAELEAKAAVLRAEKEEARQKQEEAMAIQQKAIELETKENLAAAIAEKELERKREFKEKKDGIYYAIFDSNGDAEQAVKNLVKTFERNDPYAEEKAKAIYAEYEKTRLTGTTLSNMDFNDLFDAADVAEQAAIKKEIEKDNEKQKARLEAFTEKVEEQKQQEQEKILQKIEAGLPGTGTDLESQIAVFEKALPSNDPYRKQKAEALAEQYFNQKKAIDKINGSIERTPKSKQALMSLFFDALPEETKDRKQTAERMYDNYVASTLFQETRSSTERNNEIQLISESLPEGLSNKMSVAEAIYNDVQKSSSSSTSKKQQVRAILDNLPATSGMSETTANEVYETYAKKKQAQGGTGTVAMDFASLFGAVDDAETSAKEEEKVIRAKQKQKEQEEIEAKREALRDYKQEVAQQVEKEVVEVRRAELSKAKGKKEKALAEAIEKGAGNRDDSVDAIRKALPATGDKELDYDRAAAVYDAYLKESATIEKSGNIGKQVDFEVLFAAADRAEIERLEKQFQQKQAQREEEMAEYVQQRTDKAIEIAQAQEKQAEKQVVEAEKEYEEALLRTEAEKKQRLAEETRKQEELAKQLAMEQAKREALEQDRKAEELAKIESARAARLAKEKAEADRLAKLEEERLRKERELAEKEAAEQLAMLDKQKQEAEEARRKEAERLALEQKKREEAEEKARREAELAAAKSAEEARKAEQRRLEEERKEAERLALEEQKRKEAEEKAQRDAELAAAKSAEEARKAEQRKLEEERKEAERLALEEQKRKEAEEKAQREAELAAAKAAEEAKKEEERRLEEERKVAERLALEEQKQREAEEKAKREAELAAAKEAEEARIAEQKRQEELAKEKAEEAERQRREKYERIVSEGDQAIAKEDFKTGAQKYQDALAMYPDERTVQKKLESADFERKRVEKAEADALAIQKRFDKFIEQGESELAQNNYDAAKAAFEKASELKPSEQAPKQKIRDINRTLDQLAAEEKARIEKENKYMSLVTEGDKALGSDQLSLAREKYNEAKTLKPEEAAAIDSKLSQVDEREDTLALEAEKERKRQEEAKRKYEEQQALAAEQAIAEAKRKEEERLRVMKELGVIADANAQKKLTAKEQEEARVAAYEKLKQNYGESGMSEENRKAFLSDLARLYPEGLTKENVQGKNFVLDRYVINQSNVVTIYEKKTWDWGGVFYFKNSDIAITEAIYKLEVGKYE